MYQNNPHVTLDYVQGGLCPGFGCSSCPHYQYSTTLQPTHGVFSQKP